jgi:hypothetical protein
MNGEGQDGVQSIIGAELKGAPGNWLRYCLGHGFVLFSLITVIQ